MTVYEDGQYKFRKYTRNEKERKEKNDGLYFRKSFIVDAEK